MKNTTVKEMLQRYRDFCAYIERLREKVDERFAQATTPPSLNMNGEKVQGKSKNDPMGDAAAKYIDLMNELAAKESEAIDQLNRILHMFDEIDSKGSLLMHMRYIEGASWDQVAYEMGYSVNHIWRLHSKYLGILEDKFGADMK